MTRIANRVALGALVIAAISSPAWGQDSLSAARELYATAQYDAALAVLERLPDDVATNDERLSIDLYRTLCLLAVGRTDDADRAMEQIVTRDPLFRPGDDLPPRTRAAFSDARRRVLPQLIQQQYAEAKRIFDRDEFESAAAAFQLVIDAVNDPDLQGIAQQPPLSDLLTLAAGFHDLSVKAIPPPAPPPPPPAPAPVVPEPPRIYGGDESGVTPPVTVNQDLPGYPGLVPAAGIKGVIEVVIDESGRVESAVMVAPLPSSYNKLVLNATNRWQYSPAMRDGVPVKFRKRVQITVTPPR